MKVKVTRKSLKDMYGKIMIANNIGNILEYLDADYYNSGAYGWNFDAYDVDGVLIASGYRNFPSTGINVEYDIQKKYSDMARDISNKDISYAEKKEKIQQILRAFINDAING